MIPVLMKLLLTAWFFWTLLIIYIVIDVDPEVRWARLVVKYYIGAPLLAFVTAVLDSIWIT